MAVTIIGGSAHRRFRYSTAAIGSTNPETPMTPASQLLINFVKKKQSISRPCANRENALKSYFHRFKWLTQIRTIPMMSAVNDVDTKLP